MTSWNGTAFEYDALGMVTQRTAPGDSSYYFLYTADNERLWTFHPGAPSRWTLRDLDGKVLRDYRSSGGTWSVERDYIYANGKLLAATDGTTTYHYHSDHLGTPRLITNQNGTKLAYHAYYPFGEEATFWNQDTERMKFTGHERDFYAAGDEDDLDYQHARYCNPQLGRYLTVDPVIQMSRASKLPQFWNRFSYVANNPLTYIDPTGRVINLAGVDEEDREILLSQLEEKTGLELTFDEDSGNLESTGVMEDASGKALGSGLARQDLLAGISSSDTTFVVSRNDSPAVNMGVRNGGLVRMDFADIAEIQHGSNPASTFDSSMIFLHELKHVQGLKDPAYGLSRKAPWAKGAVVKHMNRVRKELNLPLRGQYMTEKAPQRNGSFAIPFSNGPILVPGAVK